MLNSFFAFKIAVWRIVSVTEMGNDWVGKFELRKRFYFKYFNFKKSNRVGSKSSIRKI